jgi:hypothetical protein
MPYELAARLRDLADCQGGVITRSQALSAGLSRDMIVSRLGSGRWQPLHTGVYAVFSGQPDRQAILWAAVLRAGRGAALSYQTAAELDRLADRPSAAVHVTIPAERRIAGIRGVVIHRSLDAERATHPSRLPPRTRVEETVLDLADVSEGFWDAIGWVTAALGRRLTTQGKLSDALGRRARLRWRDDVTSVLSPDLAGVHSALEYRYVRDVERPHGLPKARRQAHVRRDNNAAEYRDVLYDEYALAVELDGRIAHPGDTRWLDIRRDNAAAIDGVATLRYGYRELAFRPCLVAQEVGDVLRLRGWPGSARPCSRDCPIGLRSRPAH